MRRLETAICSHCGNIFASGVEWSFVPIQIYRIAQSRNYIFQRLCRETWKHGGLLSVRVVRGISIARYGILRILVRHIKPSSTLSRHWIAYKHSVRHSGYFSLLCVPRKLPSLCSLVTLFGFVGPAFSYNHSSAVTILINMLHFVQLFVDNIFALPDRWTHQTWKHIP